ncbi:MAG: hypothetical protein J6Q94_08395 [Clostridia bacterium]|nr:hypothetical protein [Clostridia bacterium]
MLSFMLVFGSGISAFAAEESDVTPVIVVNDITFNPIRNTDDGSVVFNFSDYNFDILFTSGFSSEIMDLFSPEIIDQITSGEMETLDIVMLLVDYFGFSGDINNIVNKVLEIVTSIMGNMDAENLDIQSIIASIDFEQYAEDLKNKIKTAVQNALLLKMNDDGTPANANIGAVVYPESLEYYYGEDSEFAYSIAGDIGETIAEEIGYENTYVFTYDWRLDPIKNAGVLSDYIENVKSETGAEKVSIISEGYGSTIATTYLAENEDTAADSVHNFVTVSSAFLGTSLVGDYLAGNTVNEFTNITSFTSAYIRYTNDISDNPMTAFVTWLLNYIMNNEWELQQFCFEIEKILSIVNYTVDASGITAEIAKMPGIWALVPVSDYEDAVENIFGDDTDSELYEAIDAFKEYQYDYEGMLQYVKEEGVNISVVSAWDLQIMPLGKNYSVQSDGIIDTAYSSFGATCVDLNDVGEATKVTQMYEDGHKHVSTTYDMLTPWYAYGGICKYIDASTCALPENTWFIKNMKHGTFNWESNSIEFLIWLITAESERTVWQDAAYKQFMTYNRYINPGILSSDGVVSQPAEPGTYLLGDINLDGLVTSLDAKIALSINAGSEYVEEDSIAFKNGDINADGVIDKDDAAAILLMSSGLVASMQSGIKFDYETEQGSMDNASYEIELRPSYNSVKNQLVLSVYVLKAKGSFNGNFVIKYDTKMFTFANAKMYELKNGYTVAGGPADVEGTLTCGYAVNKAITASDCDSNGDLLLGTLYLDVSREIIPTALAAGASYFYEDDLLTFVEPVSVDLDEDFFLMLGDADNNRYLSAHDARTILRIAAKLEQPTDDLMATRCDVDCDGKITAKDARLVLRAAAKLIDSF